MDNETLTYQVPTTLDEARRNLTLTKEQFSRSPTYHYARAIQIAQRQFDALVKEARDSFFHFDGGKGFHTLSKEEILVSAIKELLARSNELAEMYKGIQLAPTSYIQYFHTVAKHALKDTGNTTEIEEITKL